MVSSYVQAFLFDRMFDGGASACCEAGTAAELEYNIRIKCIVTTVETCTTIGQPYVRMDSAHVHVLYIVHRW